MTITNEKLCTIKNHDQKHFALKQLMYFKSGQLQISEQAITK